MCSEFGIISAPKDAEVPDSMYDMPQLQNTNGGTGPRPHQVRVQFTRSQHQSSDDSQHIKHYSNQNEDDFDSDATSEDEDTGYDDSDNGDSGNSSEGETRR